MKKIPDHMDNPIDNFLISVCDDISEGFYETGHTPNMITTYSLITGLLSCYFLYKKNLVLFAVFYFLSYFFDCLDGHFARKYDMATDFGDMYDHAKDLLVLMLVLYITYKKSYHNINGLIVIIIFLSIFLSMLHLSCQEQNCDEKFKNKNNGYFQPFIELCGDKENIYWSRFFGTGTLTLVLIALICYVNRP